jgi:hypothetical protein
VDAPDVYAAYGVATHYAEVISMLRLRLRDDTWRAFPYYGLTGLHYDPALGIELAFVTATVRVRGRNLFPLFNLLGDHAVRWVWEADRANWLLATDGATAIERIEVGVGTLTDPKAK